MHRLKMQRGEGGVTLLETMITVAVLSILLAVAVPSYQAVTTLNRIAGEENALLSDFQYARAEALRRGASVVVCASSNSSTAAPTCSGSPSWTSGWIVFADSNGDKVFDGSDVLLRAQDALLGGAVSDTLLATPNTSAVAFNREGFPGLPATVTFAFHDAALTPAYTRCIQLSVVGFATVEKAGTGACQ